jgi:hypothetical protein
VPEGHHAPPNQDCQTAPRHGLPGVHQVWPRSSSVRRATKFGSSVRNVDSPPMTVAGSASRNPGQSGCRAPSSATPAYSSASGSTHRDETRLAGRASRSVSGSGSHTGRRRSHTDLRRAQCNRCVLPPSSRTCCYGRSGVVATVQGVPACRVPPDDEGPAPFPANAFAELGENMERNTGRESARFWKGIKWRRCAQSRGWASSACLAPWDVDQAVKSHHSGEGPARAPHLPQGLFDWMPAATRAAADEVIHMPRAGGFAARPKGPAVGTTVLHQRLPERWLSSLWRIDIRLHSSWRQMRKRNRFCWMTGTGRPGSRHAS